MTFDAILGSVEIAAGNNIKAEQGDYELNGILYCGKCKTPKQVEKVIVNGQHPMCLCKCAEEKRDRDEAELKQRKREKQIEEKRRKCFSNDNMQKWTFANDDLSNPKITQAMQRYVENFPELRKTGQGLLLYGKVGTGKTFAAAEVANALIDKGYSVFMTNFARIANTVSGKYSGKQEYYDRLNNCDLLIIDDLATERKTEYMQEIVHNVVDSRYRAGLPMIITTNLTNDELKNAGDTINQRILDRIIERCHPIEVKGKNRRHEKTRKSYGELNRMFGLQ